VRASCPRKAHVTGAWPQHAQRARAVYLCLQCRERARLRAAPACSTAPPPTQCCLRRLSGKAALYGGDTAGASADFAAAVELDAAGLAAWEGIAQLKAVTGDVAEAAEIYQKLVRGLRCTGESPACAGSTRVWSGCALPRAGVLIGLAYGWYLASAVQQWQSAAGRPADERCGGVDARGRAARGDAQ
jgi:hypothetical protein